MQSVSHITPNTPSLAQNLRATQDQKKRVAILYLSGGDSVDLFANNDLLTADKTKCLDNIKSEKVKFTELKNYMIIFNTLEPKPLVPQLYKKEDILKLTRHPYTGQDITDVFEVTSVGVLEVKVQDNQDKTEDILVFSLSKRSYSEFQRKHLDGTLKGGHENYSQHYNSLSFHRSRPLTVFTRMVARRRGFWRY